MSASAAKSQIVDSVLSVLTVTGLAKSHGGRTLFRDVALELSPGRRIALIGGNGAGKTTLIEIIVGMQEPDAGVVHMSKGLRVGYLPQDLAAASDNIVVDEVMAGATHIIALQEKMDALEARMADVEDPNYDKIISDYTEVQAQFQNIGGYGLEAEAHQVLAGLGFRPEDSTRKVKEMSGGWRMRVALARQLLSSPDVMILDEPTNHLDIDSVGWLEKHLAAYHGSILFVSHDRDFIDAVAERVVEVANETATEYVGGFAEFVVQREERIQQVQAAADNQARKVAHAEQFIDRFRYKATKARQVQSRIKTLEKLDAIPVPKKQDLIKKFAFLEPRRSSRTVLELKNVDAGYNDTGHDEIVVNGVNLHVERGSKIALVGPNGAGKTTLLKVLLGELDPLRGEVTLGSNVDVAQFSQHQAEVLRGELTVFQEFNFAVKDPGKRNIRTMLGSFGFSGEKADRRIDQLSGGEQTRLSLAIALVNPVNLLVLDEPTNHLDLPSCDILEDALQAYPGTVIVVTHDRHLIRSVADNLLVVRNGKAKWYDGVPEEALAPTGETSRRMSKPDSAKSEKRRESKAATRKAGANQRNKKAVNTNDLRKAAKKAERGWEAAEKKVATIQEMLADPTVYENHAKVRELAGQLDAAKDVAAVAMAKWETATEVLEAATN